MNAFPFASPLYVMAKPAGSLCNLRCQYCYYLEKAALYSDAPKEIMSDSTLEKFIDQYINSQTSPNVLFTCPIIRCQDIGVLPALIPREWG